jgi:hypothetical protein
MEKKIAVLESLKTAHYKEIIRSRSHLENLQRDKENTMLTTEKLVTDEASYKSRLQWEPDGTKANPVRLDGVNTADAESIGKYLIQLGATWKPEAGRDHMKIGTLYGFGLYVRAQKETFESNGLFEYRTKNVFFAEGAGGLKYTWNQGYINTDNPKLTARYFLNAIDRVSALKEKYQKNLQELEQNIPLLQQIIAKPFGKDDELNQLKKDVSRLEREITVKIQANQMKEGAPCSPATDDTKEAVVIQMEPKPVKSLLPQNETIREAKSLKI